MLKREDTTAAKNIVGALLRDIEKEGLVVVCYRRIDRNKHNTPNNSTLKDQQTQHGWERVTGNSRSYCWSWQAVLVPEKKTWLLPHHIPIWEDDACNGTRSLINFDRMGIDFVLEQADLPLVSRLIGERISRKKSYRPVRCWYINHGKMIACNKPFSRLLIGLRTKLNNHKLPFWELYSLSNEQLSKLGLSKAEIELVRDVQARNQE